MPPVSRVVFFSSRRRHTRCLSDWSSDVCSSDLERRRGFSRRSTLLRAAEIYGERFARPSGRVAATFEVLFLHGWAPHESQPKPLKPGSARHRLAEALETTELSTGEKAERSRS